MAARDKSDVSIHGLCDGCPARRQPGARGGDDFQCRAAQHDEAPYLEFGLSADPADYFGFYDIDHATGTLIVTYTEDTTDSFCPESTGGSGNSAEFFGVYRNDMPRIKLIQINIGADAEWGVDNLEYNSVIPEPATWSLLLGAVGVSRRPSQSRRGVKPNQAPVAKGRASQTSGMAPWPTWPLRHGDRTIGPW